MNIHVNITPIYALVFQMVSFPHFSPPNQVFTSEQTIFFLYKIILLVYIAETESLLSGTSWILT